MATLQRLQQDVKNEMLALRHNMSELSREHEQTRHNIEAVQENISNQINALNERISETAIERKKMNDEIHVISAKVASEDTGQVGLRDSWLTKIDVASLAYTDPRTHGIFSERFVEYVWVLENLVKKGKIRDVGCVESVLPQVLSEHPGLEVHGIDIRPYADPRFKFFVMDARSMRFPSNFSDQVLCVSSIEHFGLQWYGETQLDQDGDAKAAREILRVLKPSASLILTVPFGTGSASWYRAYNTSTLATLLSGYEVIRERFYMKFGSIWLPSSRAEAEKADCHESTRGIACVVARKPSAK